MLKVERFMHCDPRVRQAQWFRRAEEDNHALAAFRGSCRDRKNEKQGKNRCNELSGKRSQ